jgi:hypothetical protein
VAEALAALARPSCAFPIAIEIGVVDFTLPSREPRFHLVDVASGRIERSWLVAHGSGSDPPPRHAATLSQRARLERLSRGAYLTANTYFGRARPVAAADRARSRPTTRPGPRDRDPRRAYVDRR